MLIALGVILIVVLTAATGYFVAQEFSYVAADRGRLAAQAAAGDAAADRALRVTGRLSFMLSGAQLGITVTALLAGYLAEPFLGEGLARALTAVGLPDDAGHVVAVVLALVFATAVQMVLGELAPKNLGIARPEGLARSLSRSTLTYLAVAGPVVRRFDAAANRLLRRFGVEPVEELPQGAGEREWSNILRDARRNGELDPKLGEMLDRALALGNRTAGQAMVPRVQVVSLRADEPASRVIELLDTGHARFPVTGVDVDDLLGVVAARDVAGVPAAERPHRRVGDLVQTPLLLPESLPLPAALEELRRERRQLACVIDEYGGFAGVLTLEDIAEELVGDILDEDDVTPATAATRQADGSWLLPGELRLDEVARLTGLRLPDGDYDTLGGLVLSVSPQLPSPGDTLRIPLTSTAAAEVDRAESVVVTVTEVARRVPRTLALRWELDR